MLNPNNAPATATELEHFSATIANNLEVAELDAGGFEMLVAVDDGASILVFQATDGMDPATTAQLDQLFASRRRLAAFVTHTGWSPAEDVETSLAWLIVAVGIGGLPAVGAVRRVAEDTAWTRVGPGDLPLFGLSTAAGLRATLEVRRPLRIETDASPELYRRPAECPRSLTTPQPGGSPAEPPATGSSKRPMR